MQKTENHIVDFSTEVDADLSKALGEMVVAFGRLEDMFKVAIKRLESPQATLDEVIKKFTGGNGTLGKLIDYCGNNNLSILDECSGEARKLNTQRQDFIHATVAVAEDNSYIRFRKLVANTDLNRDIAEIQDLTNNVNNLIRKIDDVTGSLATRPHNKRINRIVSVSACASQTLLEINKTFESDH